jgi:hypothetical protein
MFILVSFRRWKGSPEPSRFLKMFERHKGEECATGQGLWPLPLIIQVLIAGVSLCV